MSCLDRISEALILLAIALVGAGLAVGTQVAAGLDFSIGHGLVGAIAAVILIFTLMLILERIGTLLRKDGWAFIPLIPIAPALIGQMLGVSLAVLFGFNPGHGLIGGCVVLGVLSFFIMGLMLLLQKQGGVMYSEFLVLVTLVIIVTAGISGAAIARVVQFDSVLGVVCCGSVPAILTLFLWGANIQYQNEMYELHKDVNTKKD